MKTNPYEDLISQLEKTIRTARVALAEAEAYSQGVSPMTDKNNPDTNPQEWLEPRSWAMKRRSLPFLANHTPGPWGAISRGDIITMNGVFIRVATANGLVGAEIQEANARLIASAPETAAERDRLKATVSELLGLLNAAVGRVELANAEGDAILSGWLPYAKATIKEARA